MIIDGRAIRDSLREEIRGKAEHLSLGLLVVGSNPVTERFLSLKKAFGESIGVKVVEKRLPENSAQDEVEKALRELSTLDGVVVQLPLPVQIDSEAILSAVPLDKDIDVLGEKAKEAYREGMLPILPPVVGAMDEILKRAHVTLEGKSVVILGRGPLVGEPAKVYFDRAGSHVRVIDQNTHASETLFLSVSDIIVCGAGSPGLLTPEMVKEGVVILDAGTSESEGKLLGDADPRCAEKASLFTPVPGGIGPITVAMIFKNLAALKR